MRNYGTILEKTMNGFLWREDDEWNRLVVTHYNRWVGYTYNDD